MQVSPSQNHFSESIYSLIQAHISDIRQSQGRDRTKKALKKEKPLFQPQVCYLQSGNVTIFGKFFMTLFPIFSTEMYWDVLLSIWPSLISLNYPGVCNGGTPTLQYFLRLLSCITVSPHVQNITSKYTFKPCISNPLS